MMSAALVPKLGTACPQTFLEEIFLLLYLKVSIKLGLQ